MIWIFHPGYFSLPRKTYQFEQAKMNETNRSSIVWHDGQVSQTERQKLLGQQPVTIWLTGLSASGKSTLAFTLERALIDQGRACYVLDGDNVRHGLSRNLGFSHEDRTENIRRIAEVARLMNDAGLIVITAFISPYRADRAMAREIIGTHNFHEVHVSTPLAVCELRDPKGFYSKAREGKLADFTGISSPYEAPEASELLIDMAETPLDQAVLRLASLVEPKPATF
jgi:adenylyl-sulfate kinase